jgi:hypothetical protein
MKNPVNIFCLVSRSHQKTSDATTPTIFPPDSTSATFFVTHGPDFTLGNFPSSSVDEATAFATVVVPSPIVMENIICPSGDRSSSSSSSWTTSLDWLEDVKNAKDSHVLSVDGEFSGNPNPTTPSGGRRRVFTPIFRRPWCWTRIIHSCRLELSTTIKTAVDRSSIGPA